MSLLINKVIKTLLSGNADIAAKVGSRLFPIVASEDTALPFIVYKRTNLKPVYTKDGLAYSTVTVQLNVISSDYTESINLIQSIRETLECIKGEVAGVMLSRVLIDTANESVDGMAYIQELIIEVQTN